MKDRPKLSIVCNIARDSHSLQKHPDWHLFEVLCGSLKTQQGDFPPFELVIADTEYDDRAGWFEKNPQPFPVKHIPVRSYWLERGCCAISRCKNESVIHAEGDYIITVDDSTVLPPNFLARCWHWFKNYNLFPAAHYRVVDDDNYRDPRLDQIPSGKNYAVGHMDEDAWEKRLWAIHGWGYVGFKADAFYHVGGYEEWFDGGRGQEDVEFSLRLMRAGHRLVIDKELFVNLLAQGPTAVYNNPEIPTGVVHCASALAYWLYEEIANGRRTTANNEPYPMWLIEKLYPSCHWYIPDRRHDKRKYRCNNCGYEMDLTNADIDVLISKEHGEAYCPDCAEEMDEDKSDRVDMQHKCALYHDPCPFAESAEKDGNYAPYTWASAHHRYYHEQFGENPERSIRDLRSEHELLKTMRPPEIEGTYVGVDWR